MDVFASLAVLAGLLISKRRSRSFPYGLYKVENLASVIIALLIFIAGYEIAHQALFGSTGALRNVPVAALGIALAGLIGYLFSLYERRLGRETGSPTLLADSKHFQADMLTSAVVLIAVLGDLLRLPLDRLGAAVIVVFIVHAGWGLLVDGMRVLLDASLDQETLAKVRDVIAADPRVASIRSLTGRNSGRYRFLEAEVTLRLHDLETAHKASQELEAAIRAQVPHVDRVLIHYEPEQKDIWRWAVPLANEKGEVSAHLSQSPLFALVELRRSTGQAEVQETLANPYLGVEKQRGIRVAEFLVGQGIDGLALKGTLEGKGPEYVFASKGVEVLPTERASLAEVVADLAAMSRAKSAEEKAAA